MSYLSVLVLFFISAIVLEHKSKIPLFHSVRERLTTMGVIFIIGITADYYGVYSGHWVFPGKGLAGVWIGKVPIEDYIFAFVAPYWAIVVYNFLHNRG